MSDSVRPHRRQPTRLRRPWDSPGKNSGGVAISFSNAWKRRVKVKSLSRVWLLATPWTAAYQVPLSMDFPGKSTGVGCHCLLRPTCLLTHIDIYIHTHTHIHTCLYSSSCTHVYLHTQTSHALIHAHSYTHKHLRGHTLTHIRTCARWHLKDVSSVVFCVLPVSGS